MNATELITQLAGLGVKIQAVEGQLKIRAPKGVITAELKASLSENKHELIKILDGTVADSAIVPVPRDVPLVATTTQERFLFLSKMYPDAVAYNLPNIHILEGPLNVELFEDALTRVVNRHEALRTTFVEHEGVTLQHIAESANHSFEPIDLKQEQQARQVALKHCSNEINTAFDLSNGPLLRVKLFRCSDVEYVFCWTLHHSISDGWSSMIFLRELRDSYENLSGYSGVNLPEPVLQYADFGAWEHKRILDGSFNDQLNYWLQVFEAPMPALSLPTDFPRLPVLSYKGRCVDFAIPKDAVDRLKSLSRNHGVTFFTLLLSAYSILLKRYSNQEDICIGTPIARRNHSEIELVYGCFINTLALRFDLGNDPTVVDYLQQVRSVCLDAFANQDIPFERIVEEVNPERNSSITPLFQAMFIFHVQDSRKVDQIADVSLSQVDLHVDGAKYDLTLELTETGEGLRGFIEYNSDIYKETTVQRMTDHLICLLGSMAELVDVPVSRLQILGDRERSQLLNASNYTQMPPAQGTSVEPEYNFLEAFQAAVLTEPDKVAVVSNGQALTYRELDGQSNSIARMLRSKGVNAGHLVGLCLHRSVNMVVALLGVLKSGGAYVPLDPDYPVTRLQYMLETADVKILLTQSELMETCKHYICERICIERHLNSVEPQSTVALDTQVTADQLAYVIFTSGSTGKPKGVQIYHGAMSNFLYSMAATPGFGQSDTLLAVTTLSFDISVLEIYLPLLTGGTTVIADRNSVSDGAALRHMIDAHDVTVMQATPSTWRLLLLSGWTGNKKLKALCGGEALPIELVAELSDRVGELWNMYGPTETTVWSTIYPLRDPQSPIRIGKPIANTQCFVLDQAMQLCPIGVHGELYIGGHGISPGYLHREDLTTERFVDNPLSKISGDKIYRTGDLVAWCDDGNLEYFYRLDDQVKIRGFRIELGDVEAALVRYPGVHQAAAKIFSGAHSEDKRMVGFVSGDTNVNVTEIRAFLESELPAHMVPTSFVSLEELPLTSNGKVDKKALPEPDFERPQQAVEFASAESEAEVTIAEIWQDYLAVSSVGVNDNFFDLGGHSILLVKIQSRLQQAFNKNVKLLELFQHTTVRAQSKLMQGVAEKHSLTSAEDRGSKQRQMLQRMRQVNRRNK